MDTKTLNIIGLILDIIGAFLMFWHTPHPSNVSWIGDEITEDLKIEKRQKVKVRFGMITLIAGFIFQLVSDILS